MRLPDFFIIGAAKSGTTSLQAILDTHPRIFMPELMNEPEFFARDDRFEKGVAQYADLFSDASDDQIIGEASPIYSVSPFFPNTAARIKKHAPKAKFIYIMRNPVQRSYSVYAQFIKNHQRATGDLKVGRTFEEFITADLRPNAAPRDKVFAPYDAHYPDDPDLCLVGSDYLYQINCYLEHFPIDRFLFLKFEDFLRSEPETIQKITDFLGVDPVPESAFTDSITKQNVSHSHFEEVAQVGKINSLAQKSGPAWALRTVLPKSFRQWLRRVLLETSRSQAPDAVRPAAMLDATRVHLARRFQGGFEELSKITGLDLSEWR